MFGSIKFLMIGALVISGLIMVQIGYGLEAFSQAAAQSTTEVAENFQETGEKLISGYKALQVWDEAAMANAPTALKIWLWFMMAVFAVGLLFIFRHRPARWLIGGFVAMALVAVFLVPAMGLAMFTGLAALLHVIFWTPGLYLLLREAAFLKGLSVYGVWAGVMALVILISFIFDVRDAAIYLDHMMGTGMLS